MHYDPFKAGQIINAVCVLHNMCMRANLAIEDEDQVMADDNLENEHVDEDAFPRNVLAEGQQRRANLIELYF